MIGRAKVGVGGGPEAFGRGAAPAWFCGKSKAKLPSLWPGEPLLNGLAWGSFPLPTPERGGA
jgi:hypothetical protein